MIDGFAQTQIDLRHALSIWVGLLAASCTVIRLCSDCARVPHSPFRLCQLWCNARVSLIQLLGMALFCLSCSFLHVSCSSLHALVNDNQRHLRAHTHGPLHSRMETSHGRTANTHRRGSAVPIPCLCIHDIAGAQQSGGSGRAHTNS